MGDLRHRRDIEHIEARVTERLGEQQPGRRPDTGAPGVEIAWIDEARVEAEAAQGVVQEVVRPTVERSARENVGPGTSQGRHCEVQRRLTARGGEGADPAVQRGDAFLQDGGRRVGDARIDMTRALHVEERGGLVGVLEDIGGGLEDRRRPRTRDGIGPLTGMEAERIEAWEAWRCQR